MGFHRGDIFEEIINMVNKHYKHKGIALVQKIATPMKPKRRGTDIVGAYYEEKSTLDYIGIIKGVPITFDAKETSDVKKFPLSNIKDHQVEYMKDFARFGGKTFILVSFKKYNRFFRISIEELLPYWEKRIQNPGKRGYGSITLEEMENKFYEVKSGDGLIIDYLKDFI